MAQTAPAERPRFGFQGMQIDQVSAGGAEGAGGQAAATATGMYYDNARFYDPVNGRFLNQDPLGYGAGDPNVYRFVGNDPTGATDPSGMDPNLGGGDVNAGTIGTGSLADFGLGLAATDSTSPGVGAGTLADYGLSSTGYSGALRLLNMPSAIAPAAPVAPTAPMSMADAQELALRSEYQFYHGAAPVLGGYQLVLPGMSTGTGQFANASPAWQPPVVLDSGPAPAWPAGQNAASLVLQGPPNPNDPANQSWVMRNLDQLDKSYEAFLAESPGDMALHAAPTALMVAAGAVVPELGLGELTGDALGLDLLGDGIGEGSAAVVDAAAADSGVVADSADVLTNVGCFRPGTMVLSANGDRRPIEYVGIGQRVATPEQSAERPANPITQATHRVIRLRTVRDGQELRMSFLRPADLVGGLVAGDTVQLNIFELQVNGPAEVLGVDPCPPLEEGAGRLVTGTAVSDSVEVLRVKLAGLAEPLEVTGNHPVFSEDHQDFVSAKVLRPGDRLRTADGAGTVVEEVTRLLGRYDVHNLEVDGAHQYYVTGLDVLVHNAGTNGLISLSNGDVQFQGMTVQVQEDLTHMSTSRLQYMAENGTAGVTENGEVINLHHVAQDPNGPLWEISAPLNNVNNLELHPYGNTPGAGLTLEQRAAFNDWRTAYWQARANQELARRAFEQTGTLP